MSIRVGTIVIRFAACAALLGSVTGCSLFSEAKPKKTEPPKVYSMATRQLPPEPVYNRITTVLPPDPGFLRKTPPSTAPYILPIVEFDAEDATLEEAALMLASTTRYYGYCSGVIADQKISLKSVGTVEEIADQIEKKADIRVVVDHINREIRFLANRFVAPGFEKVGEHEHKSTH